MMYAIRFTDAAGKQRTWLRSGNLAFRSLSAAVRISRARTEAQSLSNQTGKHHMALQFPGIPPKKIITRVGDVAAYNSLPRS